MSDIQHGGIEGSIGNRNIDGTARLIQRITGSMSPGSGGCRKEVISNTTEAWNSNPQLMSVKDIIYVYTDHSIINGHPIPAIKVGDGLAYLIDLPFVSSGTEVTPEQIAAWDNKVAAIIDPNDPETLILYTDQL